MLLVTNILKSYKLDKPDTGLDPARSAYFHLPLTFSLRPSVESILLCWDVVNNSLWNPVPMYATYE